RRRAMAERTMETRALRQQLRDQLRAGIRQTEGVLQQYRAAYPAFDQVDWPAVQTQLAAEPVAGVNVHPEMQTTWRGGPAWIPEQTIQPLEFGSLADPVSQAAFLLAPGLLRSVQGGLDVVGSPGPRVGGYLRGEAGNLGPVPRGQRAGPLSQAEFE